MVKSNAQAQPSSPEILIKRVWREHSKAAIHSWRQLRRNLFTNFVTWITLAVTLALPGILIILLSQVQSLTPTTHKEPQVSVFLSSHVEVEGGKALAQAINKRHDVDSVTYISAAQALHEFSNASGLQDIFSSLTYNPLPATLLLQVNVQDIEVMDVMARQLSDLDGVDQVIVNQRWLERLQALIGLSQKLIWVLMLLLLLGVLLVMGNTIRLQMESYRDEILVIKLAGGTDAYLRRPFMYSALWSGLIAGWVACAIMATGIYILQTPFSMLAESFASQWQLYNLSLTNIFVTLLGSCLLSLMATLITLVRQMEKIEPS